MVCSSVMRRVRSARFGSFTPLAGALPALLLSLGCDDGATIIPAPDAPADEADGTGVETPDDPPEAGPLYALGVRVESAESRAGYILTVPSLDAGTSWSLDEAIEVGQDAWLSGTDGEPQVFVSSSNEPTVTRWQIDAAGKFSEPTVLSFANLGLQRSREVQGRTAIYLKDKAYFLSSDGQIVIWNPSDMTLIGTIPWEVPAGLSPEGLFSGNDERVFMTVSFYRDDSPDWTVYEDSVHLVEIDPSTDQIIGETEEPRCTNLSGLSLTDSGTSYHSPYAPYTSLRATLGEGHGPLSCSLRIVPPSRTFDEGYDVDLDTLVGGRPAGGLFMLDDETAFIRAWHAELAPPLAADRSNFEELMFASAYQWWRWQVGAPSAELVPGQEPTTGQWDPFDVDGRALLPKVAADYASTELVELLPEGGMEPMISGPGTLLGVVRVR